MESWHHNRSQFALEKQALLDDIARTSVGPLSKIVRSTPVRRFSGKQLIVLVGAAGIVTVALGSVYALRPTSNNNPAETDDTSGQSARAVADEKSEPQLATPLTQALQAGYTLFACKGETKETWSLDGIKPTPDSYPDRTEQHPTTILFRVKWGATPPFDMFNPQLGDWAGACDTNCIVLGGPEDFKVTKPNQGSAEYPGGIAQDMEFHYENQNATMRVSVAENTARADADPRVQMIGITHDEKFFSGQCRNIEKYSDLPS